MVSTITARWWPPKKYGAVAVRAHLLETYTIRRMPDKDGLTEPEYRTLALHRAVAKKLRDDPSAVLAVARKNIALYRSTDAAQHSEPYIAAWESLVDGPLDVLLEAIVSLSQESKDLRQSTPFAGVLSDDERWDILEEVYQVQHPTADQASLGRIARMRFAVPAEYRRAT
jgi:hypothetical protein